MTRIPVQTCLGDENKKLFNSLKPVQPKWYLNAIRHRWPADGSVTDVNACFQCIHPSDPLMRSRANSNALSDLGSVQNGPVQGNVQLH